MKKHLIKLLVLTVVIGSFIVPATIFADVITPAPEDANQVLAKAVQKILTNYKGQMYSTDTTKGFMMPSSSKTRAYVGLFLTTATSTQSLESVTDSDIFEKIININTGIAYLETESHTQYFVNGAKSATTSYSYDITKMVQGKISEIYKSTAKVLDKNTLTLSTQIDSKLKSKGISDTVRIKTINKLQSSLFLKLNARENLLDMDTLFGFKTLALETPENIDIGKVKDNFLPYIGTLFKIKKDEGEYDTSYTYYKSVYSTQVSTTTYATRKLVLSLDTDALVDAAIKQNATKLIPGDITQATAIESVRKLMKDLYGEFEIEMYIDSKTYDIRELNIPEYQIQLETGPGTKTMVFSYHLGESGTSRKTLTLPTKFTTPAVIRALYTK